MTINARVIHDLSHPSGASMNDQAQIRSEIIVTYDGAAVLACRVLQVDEKYPGSARMAAGDVAEAFRNVSIAAEAAGRFRELFWS